MAISVKMIRPKPLNTGAMSANVRAAAKKASIDLAVDMSKITTGWSDGGLKFVGKVEAKRDAFVITATPANQKGKRAKIWSYLDEGTGLYGPKGSKYPIRPKRPGYPLRFKSGYTAGSKPNTVTTTKGKSFGTEVRAMEVMHPGIKARNWTKLRYAKWKKKMPDYLSDGLALAAKESGHAI